MPVLPQEIQIWYVLPALRRELALILVREHGFHQRRVAEVLGISEGAVSQYLSLKRGAGVELGLEAEAEVRVSADRIFKDNSLAMQELVRLSSHPSVKRVVCRVHVDREPSMRGCSVCFRGYDVR